MLRNGPRSCDLTWKTPEDSSYYACEVCYASGTAKYMDSLAEEVDHNLRRVQRRLFTVSVSYK